MEEGFLDYCLRCDRQTSGEAYCCQACRLADLETSAGGSASTSMTSTSTNKAATTTTLAFTARSPTNSGFYLPPAFDFSAYRRSPPPSATSSRPSSWFSTTSSWLDDVPTSPRLLSPSASRNSLKNDAISTQAKTELQGYTNSFDRVRDWRRRKTTG